MKDVASTGDNEAFRKSDKKSKIDQDALKSQFLVAALSMSWQLAAVVLIPVYAGWRLDQHFKSSPTLTLIGFGVAVVGVVVVLKRTLEEVSVNPKTRRKT